MKVKLIRKVVGWRKGNGFRIIELVDKRIMYSLGGEKEIYYFSNFKQI